MAKSIVANKMFQESPADVWLDLLSYMFRVLFTDTPLTHACHIWSHGQIAINGPIDQPRK